jgi:hypothetical protein
MPAWPKNPALHWHEAMAPWFAICVLALAVQLIGCELLSGQKALMGQDRQVPPGAVGL